VAYFVLPHETEGAELYPIEKISDTDEHRFIRSHATVEWIFECTLKMEVVS